MQRNWGVVVAACIGITRVAAGEGIVERIQPGPGVRVFVPSGCSFDGSVVVGKGYRSDDVQIEKASYWTTETGVVFLDSTRGAGGSDARSISNDGAVIVGRRTQTGFRFTVASGLQVYPQLLGVSSSLATRVSRGGQRVRIDSTDVWARPNVLVEPSGVQVPLTRTMDGRTLSFAVSSPNLKWHVAIINAGKFLISDLAGNDRILELPGLAVSISAVSDDGSRVGGVYLENGRRRGIFRATLAGAVERVAFPAAWSSVTSPFFSDDLTVATFGVYSRFPNYLRAYAWREGDGIHPIASFLRGAFPTPRYVYSNTGVLSGDGAVVVQGFYAPPASREEYYRLTLDAGRVCRADFDGDGIVADSDFVIFLQSMELIDAPFIDDRCDLNDDGMVEDADFGEFALAYGELVCP